MKLYKFFKLRRKELKESQSQFYNGIFARGTANKFEKGEEGLLKLKHIPQLLDHIDISFDEFSHYCSKSLDTVFDKYNSKFLEISQIFANDSMGIIKLSTSEASTLLKTIEDIYTITISKREKHTNYFNLNILIRVSFSKFSDKIIPVDNTDLTLLKKIFKDKIYFTSYDYKIFANMVIMPNIKYNDLAFLEKKLFPVIEGSAPSIFETSHLALTNVISLFLRNYDYKNTHKYLKLLHENLNKSPSYRYKLIYLHDKSLLEFLESNYTKAESLSNALLYIDLINQCEPEVSTFSNRMREATVNLIEKKANTKEIIAMIATTKSDIDFTKNIPPHLIKE